MNLREVIELLADGKSRTFTTPGLSGYFYKAKYPPDEREFVLDGTFSAITYWDKETHQHASPVLLLDELQDDHDEWTAEESEHPALKKEPPALKKEPRT